MIAEQRLAACNRPTYPMAKTHPMAKFTIPLGHRVVVVSPVATEGYSLFTDPMAKNALWPPGPAMRQRPAICARKISRIPLAPPNRPDRMSVIIGDGTYGRREIDSLVSRR